MLIQSSYSDAKLADKEKAAFLKALGIKDRWSGPSWPLPHTKEVAESDFWGWRSSYSFNLEAWVGQMKREGQWSHLLVYWLNQGHLLDGGFAVLVLRNDYPKPNTVRYFEWRACAHEFREKRTGNCQHRYTCTKCSASYDVDSSG